MYSKPKVYYKKQNKSKILRNRVTGLLQVGEGSRDTRNEERLNEKQKELRNVMYMHQLPMMSVIIIQYKYVLL